MQCCHQVCSKLIELWSLVTASVLILIVIFSCCIAAGSLLTDTCSPAFLTRSAVIHMFNGYPLAFSGGPQMFQGRPHMFNSRPTRVHCRFCCSGTQVLAVTLPLTTCGRTWDQVREWGTLSTLTGGAKELVRG